MADDFGLGAPTDPEEPNTSKGRYRKHPVPKTDDQYAKLNSRMDNMEASVNDVRNITKEILSVVKELRKVMPRLTTSGPENHLQRTSRP